ncbi:MAG: hypothetical protein RBR15_05420 [Sphaerochaeta sp.]|nr:hypothetical protein [Sphaerochaeta sp.]
MRKSLLVVLLLLCVLGTYADQNPDNTGASFHRDYSLALGAPYDLSNSVINSRSMGKALIDTYYRGVGPQISSPFVRNLFGALWSFTVTWSATTWPHEFGHYLRTKQVGGDFWIKSMGFPGPEGGRSFPEDATLEDELLFAIGGLEVNSLIALGIQQDTYRYNGLYNDELYAAFFHRIIYPTYLWLTPMMDPSDPANWIDEDGKQISLGDVASVARLILERQGKKVLLPDGTVNPELLTFYKNAQIWSLIWNLADINLYYQVAALFKGELDGTRPPYLIGDSTRGWSYGMLANASVLGAELYFNNYLSWDGRHYWAYLKYGFPYTDYGIGLGFPDILQTKALHADLELHAWHQEYYGTGVAVKATLDIPLSQSLSAIVQPMWKLDGYLLGTPIGQGFSGYIGLTYRP